MKYIPNSKETSAKISILVTIFVIKPLIVAKSVQSGPSKLPKISIWRVTKNRSILFEIGVQLQRDQCQNFISGHNFMDKTFD